MVAELLKLTVKRFKGFTEDSFNFYSELEKNNNLDWFSSNRGRYEAVKNRLIDLITDIGELYIKRKYPDLETIADAKRCISRPIKQPTRNGMPPKPYYPYLWGAYYRKSRKRKSDDFQLYSARAHLGEEDRYEGVFEIFDLISRNSYQAGFQHYLSFFGAERYYRYKYGGDKEPKPEILTKFPGLEIDSNVEKLHKIIYSTGPELESSFDDYRSISYISTNSATAFLMFRDPNQFIMVNQKPIGSLAQLGVDVKKSVTTYNFNDYNRLLEVCSNLVLESKRYQYEGFKDFLELDYFFHLVFIARALIYRLSVSPPQACAGTSPWLDRPLPLSSHP